MAVLDLVPDGRKNVGGYDRLLRAVAGLGLAAGAVMLALTGRALVAALAMIVAVGLLLNAATQFCGINAVLGIDTCSRRAED
jgi:hypothetical protein